MPFMTARLAAPGVKVLQTPTLLPANIVESQNIRWRGGLPEKIGGWQQYYAFTIPGITREMWAWADLDGVNHVAVGGTGGVTAITGNLQTVVTPLYDTVKVSPTSFTFTAGSSEVIVNAVGSNATTYESLTLQTPIAGGGIVLYPGNYAIVAVASPDQFTISIAPQVAAVSGASFATATFATTANSAIITVTLPNHGLSPGSNFSVVEPTSVGGLTLSGFYQVLTVEPSPTGTASAAYSTGSTFTLTEAPTAVIPPGTLCSSAAGLIGTVVSIAGATVTIREPNPLSPVAANALVGFNSGTFTIAAQTQAALVDSEPYGNFAGDLQFAQWVVLTQQPTSGGWGIGPWGGFIPPAYRQSAGSTSGGTATFAAPVSNGGTVVVALLGGTIAGTPTLTDNQGNVYPPIASTAVGSGNTVWVYFLSDITNGPTTLTATGGVNFVAADEFAGLSGTLDGSSGLYTTGSTTTATSGSFTTTANGDLIWCAIGVSPGSWTPGAGFTAGFSSPAWGSQYQFQAAAGAIEGTAGVAAGSTTWMVALALKPSSGLTAWGQSPAPPPITGQAVTAADWDLENWGSQLIIHPVDQNFFFWDPTSGIQSAEPIVAAPAAHGFFIAMPQQMIVAYGAAVQGVLDPLLVAWCDDGDYTDWTASASNQAGTYRLTRGSKIIGGIQGPLQALLWTDVGMWLMQYIGYPDVWGFFEIARGCGLIAKKAVGVVGQVVYWMSRDGFWLYAGMGAMRLPCDVWDVIFKNLTSNTAWQQNIRCAANTGFDEISWYFPSQASTTGENDTQVKFNTVTGEWDYTQLPSNQIISEWIDTNIFGHPFSTMIDPNSNTLIMQHEMTMDAAGIAIAYSVRTGYFQLAEAQQFVFVDYVIPDFKWKRWQQPQSVSATIQLTFFVQDYPDDDKKPPIAIGPFFVTNETDAIDLRARGRYFSFQVAGNDLGSFMRLGGLKFRFAPDGRN